MLDVDIVGDQLVQNGQVVGQYSIDAPAGAVGQSLLSTGPSTLAKEPFFGRETARFGAQLVVGDLPGEYVTTIALEGGNSSRMVVNVVPEPSMITLMLPLAALGIITWRRRRAA